MSKEPTDEAIAAAYAKLSDDEKAHIQSLPLGPRRLAMRWLVLSDAERLEEQVRQIKIIEQFIDSMPPEALDYLKKCSPEEMKVLLSEVKKYKKTQEFIESLTQEEQERLTQLSPSQLKEVTSEMMRDKGFNLDE